MPGLLRRAALTIALAFGSPYRLRPFTGVFLSSLPPSASGHLGLVRSRPGLLDLNSLFTPKVFLDSTHALGAAALHYQPFLGGRLRTLRDMAPNLQAAAGDDEGAKVGRQFMALLDRRTGASRTRSTPSRASPRNALTARPTPRRRLRAHLREDVGHGL